ncbi:MAG TPA: hypothetical protein VGO52_13325 [Hyphomonadaceae bacterium]|jgi:uncharacterized membrane protein YgcG|nr:hypothetical protein [Hyphomonadaceae bacterium]
MPSYDDLISGRDALHRLDMLASGARAEFDAAVGASDGHARRRTDIARLKADAYRQLAGMRIDVIKKAAAQSLTDAERKATDLLIGHEEFVKTIGAQVDKAADELSAAEAKRRAGEVEADAALEAYETLTEQTEKEVQSDPGYIALKDGLENAKSVTIRSEQKLDLAKQDRDAKRKPYEGDPLFSYLWQRKFRTTEYKAGGLTRGLDNWVAKLCGYDAAYLNYARLTELPDRIAEHLARMELEETEAEAAIERFEAQKLEEKGAGKLSAALDAAKARLKQLDAELATVEARHSALREQQEKAASGDSGPQEQARRVLEEGFAKASFPDLKVLAAETTTLDDDRIVDVLIKLRTEELQMEVNWRNVEALPARRRAGADALESVRRRFRESGLDSPYVMILRGAFEAALEAYGKGPAPDANQLWRAITSTVHQAPQQDDHYFGGRRRGQSVGLPAEIVGGIAGAVINEVIREATRGGMRGRWGGGGPWGGGGFGGGSSSSGGGGFRTTGRIGGGGGFKTTKRF